MFDIGETLVRDDRYWASWADWLGVPRHTLSALVGAVTAQGLRRGPWGHLWAADPQVRETADWVVDSLMDLPAIVNE